MDIHIYIYTHTYYVGSNLRLLRNWQVSVSWGAARVGWSNNVHVHMHMYWWSAFSFARRFDATLKGGNLYVHMRKFLMLDDFLLHLYANFIRPCSIFSYTCIRTWCCATYYLMLCYSVFSSFYIQLRMLERHHSELNAPFLEFEQTRERPGHGNSKMDGLHGKIPL